MSPQLFPISATLPYYNTHGSVYRKLFYVLYSTRIIWFFIIVGCASTECIHNTLYTAYLRQGTFSQRENMPNHKTKHSPQDAGSYCQTVVYYHLLNVCHVVTLISGCDKQNFSVNLMMPVCYSIKLSFACQVYKKSLEQVCGQLQRLML